MKQKGIYDHNGCDCGRGQGRRLPRLGEIGCASVHVTPLRLSLLTRILRANYTLGCREVDTAHIECESGVECPIMTVNERGILMDSACRCSFTTYVLNYETSSLSRLVCQPSGTTRDINLWE
jgi:hypothetical protein